MIRRDKKLADLTVREYRRLMLEIAAADRRVVASEIAEVEAQKIRAHLRMYEMQLECQERMLIIKDQFQTRGNWWRRWLNGV